MTTTTPMRTPTGTPTATANGHMAIELEHVAKTYRGKVRALRGISMHVRRGEVFGLLGPNGAGKSTLVKILMTVIKPSKCVGTMLSAPVGQKATLERVGYLPEHHNFPGYLTGRQVIDFMGAMARAPRRERRKRAGELLDLVDMSRWADKRVRSYSKGMRQRIGIAQALVNDPDLVLLDEPTDGVDPVGRRDIRKVVQQIRDEGRTVFLNSHLLSELEMVCDRVAILVQGVVSRQGTIDELTEGQHQYRIELAADPAKALETFQKALPGKLSDAPSADAKGDAARGTSQLARRVGATGELATGESLELMRNVLSVGTTQPEVVQPIIDQIRAQGGVIQSIRAQRPSLEDLFMEAVTDPETGRTLEPGAERNSGSRRPRGKE